MKQLLVLLLPWIVSCADPGRPTIRIVVAPSEESLFRSFAAPLEGTVIVDVADDPLAAVATDPRTSVAIVTNASGDGAYRLEHAGEAYVVRGDAPLGVQYGAAHLLELFGYGFYHPFETHFPRGLAAIPESELGVDHAPERPLRGLHLHTLHPIEAYFDFWEPGDAGLDRAARVVDWIVKNRGNYVQWAGLDAIQRDAGKRDAWADHSRAILDLAHARGVRVGFGIQLYGASNLQAAYDLVEQSDTDVAAAIDARLSLLDDVPFDAVQLSFGEFFGSDPATFVANLDTAVASIRSHFPGSDVSAVIHLGNYPSLQTTYMNETQLYYYLVRYASDPGLVSWVHTVMYYDLYEDAGGAYGYDTFADHRAYLYERLAAGEPTVYFPETAYWVAFDDSLPIYAPLYVRSRFVDLDRARTDARAMGFSDSFGHVLFSSGWEWGYWQNDWAALRASYQLPESYDVLLQTMWAPYGREGRALADRLVALVETEKAALVDQRLAPWIASRDWTFDLGDSLGVVGQPSRPSYAAIAAMTPDARASFRASVVDPLLAFHDALAMHAQAIAALHLPRDRFFDEVTDGVAVDVERARFAHALLEAVLAHADGDDASAMAWLDRANTYEARAGAIIDRRHRTLHHPDPTAILATDAPNATAYHYGYLREAVTRCFYERERTQVLELVTGTTMFEPYCAIL